MPSAARGQDAPHSGVVCVGADRHMDPFIEGLLSLEARRITCQPIPKRWIDFCGLHQLQWHRFSFNEASQDTIPEVPGFYCFLVGPAPSSLPPVGYPMYLGKTERTLRQRFYEYLNEQDRGRVHVRKFLNVFRGELTFTCTAFRGNQGEVKLMETALLDALMPAYSDSGFSADVRAGRGAWQ